MRKPAIRKALLKALADIYRDAAIRVFDSPTTLMHETACSALVIVANGHGDMAFAPYQYFFGQPKDYWFGRNAVYYPLMERMPEKYLERVAEVRANQEARVYSLLFMWAMARTGDIDGL